MMCPAKLANNFFDVLKNSDDLSIQRKLELLPPDMVDDPLFFFFVFYSPDEGEGWAISSKSNYARRNE